MAADGDDLASLQEQLRLAIVAEQYEKCVPLRDKIKQAQAALAAKRTVDTVTGVPAKPETLSEIETQLALAVKLCDFALCISLRDQIKFLKCASCNAVYGEDAVSCAQCGNERPPPPDISALEWRATVAGPSTPMAKPADKMRAPRPSLSKQASGPPDTVHRRAQSERREQEPKAENSPKPLERKTPEVKPEPIHKIQPLPLDKKAQEVKPESANKTLPLSFEKKAPEAKPDAATKTHSLPKDLAAQLEKKAPDAKPDSLHKAQPPPLEKKASEMKPEAGNKTQSLAKDQAPQTAQPTRRVSTTATPGSREVTTRGRPVAPPPLLSQNSAPNLLQRQPPQLDHSNEECEDQLWDLLGTLDSDGNYGVARKYYQDRGRGAFFIMFKDKQTLFEATKATFQYHTQQGLTSHGVYGTDMAAALQNYDPQEQFIGCVLLKQLSEGQTQPLFLCQLFGESKNEATETPADRQALGAKLERRLQQRPTPEQIRKSAIRPSPEEAKSTEEAKRTIWNTLSGFFRWRPKVGELERLNIWNSPNCFGIPLSQAYARSNLGDGVLVPNIVRQLVGKLRKEDVSQLVGVFRVGGDPSLTVEFKRKFDFPEPLVIGPTECCFCHTVFPGPNELKAHGKEHEGELAIPGPNLSKVDAHTIAGLLKMYLRELPEPLIPFEMYQPIHDAALSKNLDQVPAMLAKMPPINAATWGLIVDLLVEISFHQKTNMMPARNIAIMMAPNMLRLPPKLDTIARFAKDTPQNVDVIEFLIEHRAKELNLVPKAVAQPKFSVETLPPLLPPVDLPTVEVQAPLPSPAPPSLSSASVVPSASTVPSASSVPSPAPLLSPLPAASSLPLPSPSSVPSSPSATSASPPPLLSPLAHAPVNSSVTGRHGSSESPPSPSPARPQEPFPTAFPPPRFGPARPPAPPSKPLPPLLTAQSERRLLKPDPDSSAVERRASSGIDRRLPPPLDKSISSSNLTKPSAGAYKTLPLGPRPPMKPLDGVSPSNAPLRNVRPPMPPPR